MRCMAQRAAMPRSQKLLSAQFQAAQAQHVSDTRWDLIRCFSNVCGVVQVCGTERTAREFRNVKAMSPRFVCVGLSTLWNESAGKSAVPQRQYAPR